MEFEKAINLVSDTYDKATYQMECNPNVYNKKGLRNIFINKIDACLAIMHGVAALKKELEDTKKKLAECEPVHAHWEGYCTCSHCKRRLSEIMDADSYFAIGFDAEDMVACPFCGAKMDDPQEESND